MPRPVAIIGDHFMLPEVFAAKLREVCDGDLDIRTRKENWPDEPMEHGYAAAGMDGLREYFGTADSVVDFVDGAEILVTHLAPMSRAMFERLPDLRMIAVSRGGPVNIDMAAARDHGVLVVNTPGRNSTAVAEFTIGAILAETRKIRAGHEALRNGIWRGDLYRADVTGRELGELTVGVIGYGNIGTKVVRLLRAFGCRLLVTDPYIQLDPADAAAGVMLVPLETLLAESDVVTLHPRVTDETRGMINARTLALMKPDSLLVNTARGPICDYEALYEALAKGRIGGAMLDTFAVEPVPEDWPLLKLPNVTLTPHIAGASVRTVTFAAAQVADEVRRFLRGEPAKNPYRGKP
jgi:D-3-phosphoglycerate dehydrogenase